MNPLRGNSGHCDVLIAGAGLAGSALALRLAQSGRSVILVDPGPLGRSGCMDHGHRRSGPALSPANDVQWMPASCVVRLQRLGLDRWREQAQAEPLGDVLGLWGEPGGRDLFRTHPANNGWRIGRRALDTAVLRNALAAGALGLDGTTFCRLRRHRTGWRVLLDDGGHWLTIDAAVVADATGGAARVARQLGVRALHADPMVAISFLAPRAPRAPGDPSLTLFESCPVGWWHVHDAGGEARRFMLLTDPDLVPRGQRDMWSLLHQTLHDAPASLLRMVESEHTYALEVVACGNRILRHVCGDGWLALGDAAMTCDPLSASGVDLALAGAELAQATIERACAGVGSAWVSYNATAQSSFTLASTARAAFCCHERRWPDAPFWARRQPAAASRKERTRADSDIEVAEMID